LSKTVMVRIIIKGGVWKNTEDEVLKAAIAKYGKNQWARISSLLVRKTPKQCKARWYEWLDPSIKKTEWSKTEDEKLLHLAKLMPTQWRTIAPIVGRTATQCLERYQKLLDEAEAKDNEELGLAGPGEESGPSADDIRRLRPGEIDPDPETKPARPDPIDMDEDEKEMLSEARARLANTQGKKAKRKARERQLEEARRLAVLQKKRELKAAGIIMRHKVKRKGMDYNADIPFEKKPAPGFYDTSDEQARVVAAPVGQSLRRLDNKRKPEDEEAERKKRQRRNAAGKEDSNHQTKFLPARDAQIQKLKEAEAIGKRKKLFLPPAQVSENELEGIVKIGQAGENTRSLVANGNEFSDKLLSDYELLQSAKMARTPRTAPEHDNVLMEARNLRNMTMAQTPLLGDENTPLHVGPQGGSGFEGATPRHQVAFTPNPLATPAHGGPRDIGATPRGDGVGISQTPLRTPIRDDLSINPADFSATPMDTPREMRMKQSSAKKALQAGFQSLPKPENNFELLVPDDEDADDTDGAGQLQVEDAAERDARLKRAQELAAQKAYERKSSVLKARLPRPPRVEIQRLLSAFQGDGGELHELINAEVISLLDHDSIVEPLPGTSRPGGSRSGYQVPDDDDMGEAKTLVKAELASILAISEPDEERIQQQLHKLTLSEPADDSFSWAKIRQNLVLDVASGTWVEADTLSREQRIAGYSACIQGVREEMSKEAAKASKVERKLGKLLGGYQNVSASIGKRLVNSSRELQAQHIDFVSFSRLSANETAIGPRRVDSLKEEVELLQTRESMLQRRFAELDAERRESQARVAALEARVEAEAEALNEAALAAMEEAS
jgi:pre-mRNA-splicing factor CDC5/CEF1